MVKVKRPLNRSIFIVCSLFIGLLCIISSVLLYTVYTKHMFERYKMQLKSVVNFTESYINHDDMVECAKTNVDESEDYVAFQAFIDNLIDEYDDIHYVYIIQVDTLDKNISLNLICAANSKERKEKEPEELYHLGQDVTNYFSFKIREKLASYYTGKNEYCYFNNNSQWGNDYTLAHPIYDGSGNVYGLLCANISIAQINTAVYKHTFINIAMIALSGIIFIALLILWMRRNVTTPLKKLEKYVSDFAETSSGKRDPDELHYYSPEIHTKNEVEALSNAYSKLSGDLREYVIGIAEAEKEAKGLQERVTQMNAIAYKDTLTHVKNKAAYEQKKNQLIKDIFEEKNEEFGIIMADVNYLKTVNDIYGHDRGDEYIKGACKIICDVFSHSNVYRIGGDEFVILLENRDYENRDNLIKLAKDIFNECMHDDTRDAWSKYSMAIGLSVWKKGYSFDKVFSLADQNMYEDKAEIKKTFIIE